MGIRQGCHWIRCKIARTPHAGVEFKISDHPSLLAALRELSDYYEWVEERLIPIASKWIDENRERVIEGMSPEEMNDMGAAVEKAYGLLVEDGYIEERTAAEESEEHPIERQNPLWQSETRRRLGQEEGDD